MATAHLTDTHCRLLLWKNEMNCKARGNPEKKLT